MNALDHVIEEAYNLLNTNGKNGQMCLQVQFPC